MENLLQHVADLKKNDSNGGIVLSGAVLKYRSKRGGGEGHFTERLIFKHGLPIQEVYL